MSKHLLDTLENRVHSAVDTIENLRAEISDLKEERKILEEKLQELIERIGAADQGGAAETPETPAANAAETAASTFGTPISPYKDPTPDY